MLGSANINNEPYSGYTYDMACDESYFFTQILFVSLHTEHFCSTLLVDNGYVTGGSKYPIEPGAKAVYNCNPGFKFVGNVERICLSSGNWTGTPSSCIRSEKIGLLGCDKVGTTLSHRFFTTLLQSCHKTCLKPWHNLIFWNWISQMRGVILHHPVKCAQHTLSKGTTHHNTLHLACETLTYYSNIYLS